MGAIRETLGVEWETSGADGETVGKTVLVMARLKQSLKIQLVEILICRGVFGVTKATKRIETPSLSEMRAKLGAIVA